MSLQQPVKYSPQEFQKDKYYYYYYLDCYLVIWKCLGNRCLLIKAVQPTRHKEGDILPIKEIGGMWEELTDDLKAQLL